MSFARTCVDVIELIKKWRYYTGGLAAVVILIAVAGSVAQPVIYESCNIVTIGQTVRFGQVSVITHPERIFEQGNFSFLVDDTWFIEHPEEVVDEIRAKHFRETELFQEPEKPYIAMVQPSKVSERDIKLCARANNKEEAERFVRRLSEEVTKRHEKQYDAYVASIDQLIKDTSNALEVAATTHDTPNREFLVLLYREKLKRYQQMLNPGTAFPTKWTSDDPDAPRQVQPRAGRNILLSLIVAAMAALVLATILEFAIAVMAEYKQRRKG